MLTHIILTIVIVAIAGLAFAFTSHKLGRGDKRVGCGRGECSACNPEHRNTECPENHNTDTGTGNKQTS
jgi:hypothetical protein